MTKKVTANLEEALRTIWRQQENQPSMEIGIHTLADPLATLSLHPSRRKLQ